jgi:hypothetical protein
MVTMPRKALSRLKNPIKKPTQLMTRVSKPLFLNPPRNHPQHTHPSLPLLPLSVMMSTPWHLMMVTMLRKALQRQKNPINKPTCPTPRV